MPLGIFWGNSSRRYQQLGETISRHLKFSRLSLILSKLTASVVTIAIMTPLGFVGMSRIVYLVS
jgi:hypothetical protein